MLVSAHQMLRFEIRASILSIVPASTDGLEFRSIGRVRLIRTDFSTHRSLESIVGDRVVLRALTLTPRIGLPLEARFPLRIRLGFLVTIV